MYFQKRAIVVFIDETNKVLINGLYKHSQYNIVAVFSCNNFYEFHDCNYDVVIVMDNQSVSEFYAFNVVKKFLSKNKEVISFYQFGKLYFDILSNISLNDNIRILLKCNEQKEEYFGHVVPIIYITGISRDTQQILTHIMFNQVLENIGIKATNVTNSRLSNVLGYLNIKDEMNVPLLNYKDVIYNINNNIYKCVERNKSDIIIVSDEIGFMPYDDQSTNEFGLYNNIIKYALPADHVVCNIFLSEHTNDSLEVLYKSIIEETKTNNVYFSLSRYFNSKISTNIMNRIMYACEDDYQRVYTKIKEDTTFEVIDGTNTKEIYALLKKIM